MAIKFEQSNSRNPGSVASTTVQFPKAVKNGSFIYVTVFTQATGITCTCSDDHGNTYVEIDHLDTGTVIMWHLGAKNVKGGGPITVTITLGGTQTVRAGIGEYSGVDTVNPTGTFTSASGTGTDSSTPALVTTIVDQAAVSATRISATQTFTPNTNFLNRESTPGSPLFSFEDAVAPRPVGTSLVGGYQLGASATWTSIAVLLNPYLAQTAWISQ
jgi:hypothetical protein